VQVTPKQFNAALDSVGLSQVAAAKMFNANDRTVRRWALGERGIPPTVCILLRLLLSHKITLSDLSK
jgi:DNA-binding transcriptional regulator YiaG